MSTIDFPEVVFSKPAFSGPGPGLNTSANGYFQSNGFRTGLEGVVFDQTGALNSATSGGRESLLTPDTSSFIRADSASFSAQTSSETQEGLVIYTATFMQDEPIELPTVSPVTTGEIHLRIEITARAISGSPTMWVFFHDHLVFQEQTFNLQDPEQPPLVPGWVTYVFNMTYNLEGFDFFPITDRQLPEFFLDVANAMSEGNTYINIVFGNQVVPSIFDIAHVKFGGYISYLGGQISPGELGTRQRFGRA